MRTRVTTVTRRRFRPSDLCVVGLLLLFGILLTVPYSGPKIRWSNDALFYEAQKREVQGESRDTALLGVLSSSLAAPLKMGERNLSPGLRRIDNPAWTQYSSSFYRRRWTVPLLAAALDPIFGVRSLEQVSLIGWALVCPVLYLLLRRRFTQWLSLAASVFCAVLPPLVEYGHWPLTDSWGVTLLVAGLLAALLVRDSGPRWLPVWVAVVFALSFTRDLPIVLVIATGWLAFVERSRRMAVVAVTGALASLPAPLLFGASIRDNLAYAFNDYRIPADTGWGSILRDYPSQLSSLVIHDVKYPAYSPFPIGLTVTMGALVIGGIVLLAIPRHRGDSFLSLIRAASVGGLFTILASVNYTALRLELVFVPAVATGVALVGERFLQRRVPGVLKSTA